MRITDYIKSAEFTEEAAQYLYREGMVDLGNKCVRGGYMLQDCIDKVKEAGMNCPPDVGRKL